MSSSPPHHLNPQVTALSDAQKTITLLITRLARLPSTAGSSSSPSSSDKDTIRLELSAEIHQRLKEQSDALELLRQEVADLGPFPARSSPHQEDISERVRLDINVSRLVEDLKTARSSFRRAQLLAKRSLETSRRAERALHFSAISSPPPSSPSSPSPLSPTSPTSPSGTHNKPFPPPGSQQQQQQPLSQSSLELSATQDVTSALRRTHSLLSSELSRSQFAHDTLVESTEALTQLQTSYSSLGNLLSSSRNLLGTLLRSQKSDTWYLESALYILIGTVVWLVFRRLVYGPLWWVVWLPLKLLLRGSWAVFGGVLGLVKTSGKGDLQSEGESLTVKPSATGGFGTWGTKMADGTAPSVRVGGGGKDKERVKNEGASATPLSDEVGEMVEETRKGAEGQEGDAEGEGQGEAKVQPNRAGGNPKKRMWEEGGDRERYEEQIAQAKREAELNAKKGAKDEL